MNKHNINHRGRHGDFASSLRQANGKSNLWNVLNSLLIFGTPAQLNGFNLSDMIHLPHKFIFTSTMIDGHHYGDYIRSECVCMTAVSVFTEGSCLSCEWVKKGRRRFCVYMWDHYCVTLRLLCSFSCMYCGLDLDPRWWMQEFVVDSFVTHTCFYGAFSHQGTGAKPEQRVFV